MASLARLEHVQPVAMEDAVLLVLMPDEMSRNLLRMHAAWPSRPTGEFPATVT